MIRILLLIFTIQAFNAVGQEEYYLGAGYTDGLSISSSASGMGTSPDNVINGNGMDADYMEATRLLAQAALGYTESHVEDVMEIGIEDWIDLQQSLPPSYLTERLFEVLKIATDNWYRYSDREPTQNDLFALKYPRRGHFFYTWWDVTMNNEDLLRHRVAFALSEIFVISADSELQDVAEGLTTYYDKLIEHSFGNFRDLLFDVTMHPSMGFFLSHLNNPKSDPARNIFPDENYAREIMQLFTIGLYELNADGSRKLDVEGNYIPTYDNSDIKQLAKVFTGLGGSGIRPELRDYFLDQGMEVPEVDFGFQKFDISHTDPMKMYDDWHEPGVKIILKKNVIPSGQTGLQDINMALDILFNHDNVGPFIGRRLIQRLVKSNPSPGYVKRISDVFANNGVGVRGDLKAVVKAILMDEEARSCEWQQDPDNGKLREPLMVRTNLIRSLDKKLNEIGLYETHYSDKKGLKQGPMFSPTVFNFFLPDYQPVGELSDRNLFGPEFQIHDTHTAIGYINTVHEMTYWQALSYQNEEFPEDWELRVVRPDWTRFDEFNQDFESLINYLDKFYAHGRLSNRSREIIREAITPMKSWNLMYHDHTKTAINLMLISPDYTILK